MGDFPGVGIISFIIVFTLFFFMQKILHREIQYILFLFFKKPALVLALYSLLLFPGVLIHELSHFISAILLRVKVTKFSIIPRTLRNGQLRMGYVETNQTDFIRDSLIGVSPLISGLLLVASIANNKLGQNMIDIDLIHLNFQSFLSILKNFTIQTDIGIWLYLSFCISSTMIPSAADRQSWKNVFFGLAIIITILVLFGTGDWLINTVSLQFERWFIRLTFIIIISLLIHLILFFPLFIFRTLVSKASGLQISSTRS